MEHRRTRIWEAQRAGLAARLRDTERLPADRAEILLLRWEAEARERGLTAQSDGYWASAESWIADRIERRDGRGGEAER
ncbi:MAG TPA: hypothetical protein VJ850_00595 [Candidatus Limnocylindrales bacterium]|nr:hypothetical protein [Candidatus Limnocylindrales bacterium]